MKISGGFSIPVVTESDGELTSSVVAFTIELDPIDPTYIKITDSTGREYVPET